MTTPAGPWSLAALIGGRVAGSDPLGASYHRDSLAAELPVLIDEVAPLVAEETRLIGPGSPDSAVIHRPEWVRRNLGFLAHVLERAEEAHGTQSPGAEAVAALESATLLGILGRRVLGQYELVVPSGEDADTIFLVADNVLHMERANQFIPREFRTWIVLHECTHRAQFEGVPWMRGYFLDLVDGLVAASGLDAAAMERVLRRLVESLRGGEPFIDERGLFGAVASEEQRELIDRVQALMSLLEGHGHVVMDRLGERLLPTQERMSKILKRRRADPKLALLMRVTGLEMKFRQYEDGERFVLGVERLAGWDALDAVWTGPDAVPTLEEIADPERWLERVA